VCGSKHLPLTEQGFSMGSAILNYHQFKTILGLPEHMEPLGYFLLQNQPNYENQPICTTQLKQKSKPLVEEISVSISY
jgi:nicotinate-nucleotide--dimethylbenzimidazole phosphoribosyltransferase